MSVINMDQFKAMKEKQERALQYAQAYGVDINKVLTEMSEVEATEVTVTRTISRMEALQVISTLDSTVGTHLATGDYESVDIGLSLLTSDKVVMFPYIPTHDEWYEGADDDKDNIASEYQYKPTHDEWYEGADDDKDNIASEYEPTHDEWYADMVIDDDKDDIASEYTDIKVIQWNPDIPW